MYKIEHDLHVHTFLSRCSHQEENVPANIIDRERRYKMKKIGFANHLWLHPKLPPSEFYAGQGRDNIDILRRQIAELDIADMEILVGCEADMAAPGVVGIDEETACSIDYVILATNHFHMRDFVEQPTGNSPRQIAEHMMKFFISGAQCGLADILAHPCMPLGFMEVYDKVIASVTDNEFLDAFGIAADNHIGIEINAGFLPRPESGRNFSIETPTRVLTLAKQAGCKFTFGSDSHSLENLHWVLYLSVFAEALKLTDDDIMPIAVTC